MAERNRKTALEYKELSPEGRWPSWWDEQKYIEDSLSTEKKRQDLAPKPMAFMDSLRRAYLQDPDAVGVSGLKLLGLHKEPKEPRAPQKWEAEHANIRKLLARGDIDTTQAHKLLAGLSLGNSNINQRIRLAMFDITQGQKLQEQAKIQVTDMTGDRFIAGIDSIADVGKNKEGVAKELRGHKALQQIYEELGMPSPMEMDTMGTRSDTTSAWWLKKEK